MRGRPVKTPVCEVSGHGAMLERKPGTPEQAFCGTWFYCEKCEASHRPGRRTVLFPSAACLAQLDEQRQAIARRQATGIQGRLL